MHHAIEAAPGLIRAPIDIATISDDEHKARFLDEDELQEHLNYVQESMEHFRAFENRVTESSEAPALPEANRGPSEI
jgi:hypothetical protein